MRKHVLGSDFDLAGRPVPFAGAWIVFGHFIPFGFSTGEAFSIDLKGAAKGEPVCCKV
jgi:hypothetical protein